MKSPAYKAAMDYAVEVLKAIKQGGYDMDWPLEEFVKVSIGIGTELARAEMPLDQEDMLRSYKAAEMHAYRSIYLSDILGQLEDYGRITFEPLRKQCEQLHEMLFDGVKLIEKMIGKDR